MNDALSHRLNSLFARVGKAVSNPHRIALLQHLGQGERNVETLARLTGLTVANASQHLQLLRQHGLATAHKRGQNVYYRLTDETAILKLLDQLASLAEHQISDVSRLIGQNRDTQAEAIDAQELLERMRRGKAVVIDVRTHEEFEAGHLPGALHVPIEEIEERLKELPSESEVIAYCRGRYCMLANEAVQQLNRHGHRATRLAEGLSGWKLSRLPLHTSGQTPNTVTL
ncbi:MAG: metalloregulator ArsR/SmtB family transcription factor [Gammaproteobacteria bacterium]|jgi:rhodanese-related sulfurtransferase